jgi:hypothetical protein
MVSEGSIDQEVIDRALEAVGVADSNNAPTKAKRKASKGSMLTFEQFYDFIGIIQVGVTQYYCCDCPIPSRPAHLMTYICDYDRM